MAPVVVRELPSQSGDNGRLREIIIKRLMDRVSESELVVGLSALPPRGIMSMGCSAADILPKALNDVQFSLVAAADRATQLRGGAGIPTAHNDPECEGRWPRPPSA